MQRPACRAGTLGCWGRCPGLPERQMQMRWTPQMRLPDSLGPARLRGSRGACLQMGRAAGYARACVGNTG
eukprot:1158309-Pelagomonas_calceolata.AAC.12